MTEKSLGIDDNLLYCLKSVIWLIVILYIFLFHGKVWAQSAHASGSRAQHISYEHERIYIWDLNTKVN